MAGRFFSIGLVPRSQLPRLPSLGYPAGCVGLALNDDGSVDEIESDGGAWCVVKTHAKSTTPTNDQIDKALDPLKMLDELHEAQRQAAGGRTFC